MIGKAGNIAIAADDTDNFVILIVYIKIIQRIAYFLFVGHNIAVKINRPYFLPDRIAHFAVLGNITYKFVVQTESHFIFKQGTQGQAGIGIDIIIRLLVTDQTVVAVNNQAVENTVTDNASVKTDNGFKRRGGAD